MKNGLVLALSIHGTATGCSGRTIDVGSHALNDDASTEETIFLPHQREAINVFVDDARAYWVTLGRASGPKLHSCLKDQCATTKVT